MNRCPSCGKPAISIWKKILIGTNTRVACASCGATLGLPPVEVLWLLPLVGAIALSFLVDAMSGKIVVWTAGFVLGCVVKGCIIPVVRRS